MNTLFAPWRMEFIEKAHGDECVLCSIPKDANESSVYVVARGKVSYVVMNKFPYAHGHLMIVPNRHTDDWTSLSQDEVLEIGLTAQKAIACLKATFGCEAFNLGVNLGRAAGAGIEKHVHQHIVPRWAGDFNFMPLFAETKVISEHLSQTYARLKAGWSRL
jgi:ATP adenylyltransferase